MILMVLDHTRDFVHAGGIVSDPLNPATTTGLLYATRWVTHLCAPTFALLAGLGVGLRRLRGATAGEVSWFLFTRGLWLVVLEVTLFRLLVWFNLDFTFLSFLQVIWAIGASMIALSAMVRLPPAALAAIAGVILIGHNALDGIRVPFWQPGGDQPAPGLGGARGCSAPRFFRGGIVRPVRSASTSCPACRLVTAGYVMARLCLSRRAPTPGCARRHTMWRRPVLRTFNIYGDPTDGARRAVSRRCPSDVQSTRRRCLLLLPWAGAALLPRDWRTIAAPVGRS